jgi:hypothetical protein
MGESPWESTEYLKNQKFTDNVKFSDLKRENERRTMTIWYQRPKPDHIFHLG